MKSVLLTAVVAVMCTTACLGNDTPSQLPPLPPTQPLLKFRVVAINNEQTKTTEDSTAEESNISSTAANPPATAANASDSTPPNTLRQPVVVGPVAEDQAPAPPESVVSKWHAKHEAKKEAREERREERKKDREAEETNSDDESESADEPSASQPALRHVKACQKPADTMDQSSSEATQTDCHSFPLLRKLLGAPVWVVAKSHEDAKGARLDAEQHRLTREESELSRKQGRLQAATECDDEKCAASSHSRLESRLNLREEALSERRKKLEAAQSEHEDREEQLDEFREQLRWRQAN